MKLLTKFKTLIAFLMIAIFGVAATTAAVSTPIPPGGVPVESSLAVANATQKTPYQAKVNAKPDEVVNVQVWYHNPTPADSGRVAKDLNVKISLPTTKTTNHVVTSTVGGSNTNTETQVVAVSTSVNTNLSYIPGTATRRHNIGTNASPKWVTEKISDNVTTTGYVVPRLNPCWNFQESITIQARVTIPLLSIVKQVKAASATTYVTDNTARPGETLNYKIIFKNEGNTVLRNVMIRDNMPPGLDYIEGSAKLYNTAFPNGTTLSDAVASGGANIGHYNPGANAVVRIDAVAPLERNQVGTYTFNNIANVKADGTNEFYNSVRTRITYAAIPDERTSLQIIKYHDRDADRVQDVNEERLSGWTFNIVGPNGYSERVTTDNNGQATLRNLREGRYTVTEILVDGWENTTGIAITKNVVLNDQNIFVYGNRKKNPPVNPPGGGEVTTLPDTGPLDAAIPGIISLGATGGILSWVRSKKLLKKSLSRN